MDTLARRSSFHFHVDDAWGGNLIFSREHRPKLAGISQADTITVDGLKARDKLAPPRVTARPRPGIPRNPLRHASPPNGCLSPLPPLIRIPNPKPSTNPQQKHPPLPLQLH
ncbi:hypothetical protein BDK51DRAFT_36653 [Blyttiomyces helicus]|uniref:Uncharacterized protein n=1 Tax=Blyttiomyces helicus TaxID=388810 RepID=A0A4P9WKF8_9FUNG|nr:hypothetical protein BDK51DRAFT_36653 [Blyttiomyces helicus]|eukprot:RKO93479.1 hypothetical protein BDK51DRAFT_36653 [Blyttiomyces helicus]